MIGWLFVLRGFYKGTDYVLIGTADIGVFFYECFDVMHCGWFSQRSLKSKLKAIHNFRLGIASN